MRTVITIVSVAWIVSEIVLARIKHSDMSSQKLDKSSLRLLWITIITAIVFGNVLSISRIGAISTGSYIMKISGLILIVAGLIVRWTAIITLRKYFTVDVSIVSNHKLVSTGIYRFVRHPAYAGSLLSFLGLGMVLSNWLSLLVVFIPIMIAFIYRINIEEKALLVFFGDQYAHYCAMTKRLIPKIY